jgi:hypothetical protein
MKARPQKQSHTAVAGSLALLLATVGNGGASWAQPTAPGSPSLQQAATTSASQSGGAPVTTPSAEDEAAGKRHYKRGDELFKQGKYLDAAHEFEAGFAVAPRPLFLLNIGHSYRKAQELRRARVAYEDFLKADPTTSFRADVEDLMKTIDDALGASSPSAPSSPPPPAGGLAPAPAPLPAPSNPLGSPTPPVTLPPAAPAVPVRTGTIDLAPPVLLEVDKPAAPAAQSDSIFRNPWFWGAVGLVVAAGVGGTIYGLNRTPACNATRCLRETD